MRERIPIWSARVGLVLPVVVVLVGLWFVPNHDSTSWWPYGHPLRHGNGLETLGLLLPYGAGCVMIAIAGIAAGVGLREGSHRLWRVARRRPSTPLIKGRVGSR